MTVAEPVAGEQGSPATQRRRELAEFLRARRARVSPDDVGMAPGMRRRTPGLRREEVALLAGVGVTWYTWLEQGRPIRVSVAVLDAVARTLFLDDVERGHLYRLAGVAVVPHQTAPDRVSPAVRRIIDALDPMPACLLSSRFDVLAANSAHGLLFRGWHTQPCDHFNLLWCCFSEPDLRAKFLNFDEEAPRHVAQLRAAFAHHLGEPEWTTFIQRLCDRSPFFAELWARHEVALAGGPRDKRFMHPEVGLLQMVSTSLAVADMPEHRILVYTPSDERTDAALRLLVATP